jgi:hypothetical protein
VYQSKKNKKNVERQAKRKEKQKRPEQSSAK